MKFSAGEIAGRINAVLIGNPDRTLTGVSSFEEAGARDITFASEPRFINRLDDCKAGCVIVPDTVSSEKISQTNRVLLKVDQPKPAFFKIVALFYPADKVVPGIDPGAVIGCEIKIGQDPVISPNVFIGDRTRIGDNVQLYPGVYIGSDVHIGNNTIIKPNVTIMEKTRIGNDCLIHSGTVIGSDGFGFTQDSDGHEKVIHTGYVTIGSDVEIGACNTIDRGTLGTTIIEDGVKTDNLVHIAHNVRIGRNTLVVAQVGIAGSTHIGKDVIIAGKAGITGHVKIGDGSIIGPFAGVHTNVGNNEIVSGVPHMPHTRWRKIVGIISRLPELRKQLFSFEKRLKDLENKNNPTE